MLIEETIEAKSRDIGPKLLTRPDQLIPILLSRVIELYRNMSDAGEDYQHGFQVLGPIEDLENRLIVLGKTRGEITEHVDSALAVRSEINS